MTIIFKIIFFLLVNAIGFAGIALTFHALQMQGMFDQANDRAIVDIFFQKALFAWAAGAILSVGFFVINNVLKYVFLLAPIIAIAAYGLKFAFFSA